MEIILLLTACIKPNTTDKIVWTDPEERERQYIEAIKWYLTNTNYKLVFAENSGTDISNHFKDYNERIEFVTYKSAPTIPDRSRSYKEMEILEYVNKRSKLVKEGKVIVKITGRLILLNIVKLTDYILRKTNKKNGRWVSALKNINRPDSECKYIWFSPDFLPVLIAQKENIYAHYPFEWILGDAIREAKKKGFDFIFPLQPFMEHGVGSNGGIYDSSDKEFKRMLIKHKIKKLGFDLGIFPIK